LPFKKKLAEKKLYVVPVYLIDEKQFT